MIPTDPKLRQAFEQGWNESINDSIKWIKWNATAHHFEDRKFVLLMLATLDQRKYK